MVLPLNSASSALTDMASSSLPAGTSKKSALPNYHAVLTLLRGGTTVSGLSSDVLTQPSGHSIS